MDPVRSVRNQYLGINAHLHSILQGEGGWGNFHTRHLVHLADWLNAQVRSLGYVAVVEDSLQIRRADEPTRRPISINDLQPMRLDDRPSLAVHSNVVLLLPLAAIIDTPPLSEELRDKPYRAVAIYNRTGQAHAPIAWLEVLSSSTKHPGADTGTYQRKRQGLLDSGTVFIEIDYLHETPPTLPSMADYSHAPGNDSHPYRIVVLDPRPDIQHGLASLNEFAADEPIPAVNIPLCGPDLLTCDFEQVYQTTFETGFLGDLVDYALLPPNFDRYSPADRARIASRMLAVIAAAQAGADLEAGPFPAAALSLDEALQQLAGLGAA